MPSFLLHWMGESVNNLLPTARVGGDIVVARIAAMWGMSLRAVIAASIVDVTIGVVSKVFFLVTACVLIVASTGRMDLARPVLVAVVTGTLAVAGFYAVQRAGIFKWSAKLASRLAKSPSWDALVQGGEALDQTIRVIYGREPGSRDVVFSGRCRGSSLRVKFGSGSGRLDCIQVLSQR